MKHFTLTRRAVWAATGAAFFALAAAPAAAQSLQERGESGGVRVAFYNFTAHIAIMEKHGMSVDEMPPLSTAELCRG